MKKIAWLGMLSLILMLIGMPLATAFEIPLPPEDEEITGVSLSGMVSTYNSEPAYGLLKLYAKIGEWANAFAFVVPGETQWSINETWHHEWENFTYSFIFIKLDNASTVELNYTGVYNLYVEGLWSVYDVTISYTSCDYFNISLTPIQGYEEVTGQLVVTDNWSAFTINIDKITVSGIVVHYHLFSVKFMCHDFTNDNQVDVFDLMMVAKAHGKVFGMFEYNFEYDVKCDFQIDIYDLLEICSEFE